MVRGPAPGRRASPDVLARWYARGQIDDAQLAAGRWLRRTSEAAGRLDMAVPALGPSHGGDPDAAFLRRAKRLEAGESLRSARAILGEADYLLLWRIVVLGVRIEEEACRWPGREPALYVGRRVRDGLTLLASRNVG